MTELLFPLESEPGDSAGKGVPLPERFRPRTLEEVLGQDHLLGQGGLLREIIGTDEIPSMIFWGPPGVGKTTLARIIARHTRAHFASMSAVLGGVKEVKRIVEEARTEQRRQRRTILFVDEIHRFNKSQQDAFLPHVESGLIVLIGATTENPSFEVIPPLLSRSRVLSLNPLSEADLLKILERALSDPERGLGGWNLQVDAGMLEQIALFSDGDARMALGALEVAAQLARSRVPENPRITGETVRQALQRRLLRYDKAGEEHFNAVSALHKSLRNSDADASLYWLARMLEAGEDPLYVVRRLIRFASEDVGTADPAALGLAVSAMQAVHFLGMPEGSLALAELAVYLAQAPKSDAVYRAYREVCRDVEETRNEPVPLHLRNAPTRLMKEMGYGAGYRYFHDDPDAAAKMECLPESLRGRRYYRPSSRGLEKEIASRLEEVRKRKTKGAAREKTED